MIERHQKKVRYDIRRAGTKTEIRRPSGGTEKYHGKTEGESYDPVTDSDGNNITEYIVPNTHRGDSIGQESVSGGTVDSSKPSLLAEYGSIIQEGDRVDAYGVTYEVQNVYNYPTHKLIEAVNINGQL